ncbi:MULTISPECIES: hypothetical protein [Microbacterium]|uniref:hypothetical protein n=1 Tax=Microbacterium TaxID=33882 RepID=UPI00277F70D6|nr:MULTISPECIES: hypothetical protein [Microbacterium]MDQ1082506.1 hypothetical protein [Microbacterium sp. SORGH_AS_0344]MDQ1168723.1 hypothetical protein [Microbacterium proteolyticum]
MGVAEFLSRGDVVNVVLTEEAYPFVRDEEERARLNLDRNGLQGRVVFADQVGLHVHSHGGRCMPLFEGDSSKVEDADLDESRGTFFPWGSVVSVVRVTDSAQYEESWQKHERDEQAFYNANGSWAESGHEFFSWRNSISQTAYDAAYNGPDRD